MTDSGSPRTTPRRPHVLLAAGAAAGLTGAALALLTSPPTPTRALLPGAVASVNGEPILAEELEGAVAALASDRGEPLGDEDRGHVLDRLIDEELLLERAISLGLVREDRRVRADLISSLVEAVVSESTARRPTDEEVEAFYREHLDYFTLPGRVLLEQVFVRAEPSRSTREALARAHEAAGRLRGGEDLRAVEQELGDEGVPLPAGPLPPKKLLDYLGPTVTRSALELEAGEVGEPVRSASGFHVLRVVDRRPSRTPLLEEIREEVRAEVARRRGEEALRYYLDDLRRQADVRIRPKLP